MFLGWEEKELTSGRITAVCLKLWFSTLLVYSLLQTIVQE